MWRPKYERGLWRKRRQYEKGSLKDLQDPTRQKCSPNLTPRARGMGVAMKKSSITSAKGSTIGNSLKT